MTSNEKRLMLLKKIINSDNDGIDILYRKLVEGTCKCHNIKRKDIIRAMAESATKYIDDHSMLLLFGIIVADAVYELFDKEEK